MGLEEQTKQESMEQQADLVAALSETLDMEKALVGEVLNGGPSSKEMTDQAEKSGRSAQALCMAYGLERFEEAGERPVEVEIADISREMPDVDVPYILDSDAKGQTVDVVVYPRVGTRVELPELTREKGYCVDFSGSMQNKSLKTLVQCLFRYEERGIVSDDTKISLIHDIPDMEDHSSENIMAQNKQLSLMNFSDFKHWLQHNNFVNEDFEWIDDTSKKGVGSTPVLSSIGTALLDPSVKDIVAFTDGGSDVSATNIGAAEASYMEDLMTTAHFALQTDKSISLVIYNSDRRYDERIQTMINVFSDVLGEKFQVIWEQGANTEESIQSAMAKYEDISLRGKLAVPIKPNIQVMNDSIPNVRMRQVATQPEAGSIYKEVGKLPDVTEPGVKVSRNPDGTYVLPLDEIFSVEELQQAGGGVAVTFYSEYREGRTLNSYGPQEFPIRYTVALDLSGSMSSVYNEIGETVQNIGATDEEGSLYVYGTDVNARTGVDNIGVENKREAMVNRGGYTPGWIAFSEIVYDKLGDTSDYHLRPGNHRESQSESYLLNMRERMGNMLNMLAGENTDVDALLADIENPVNQAAIVDLFEVDTDRMETNSDYKQFFDNLLAKAGVVIPIISDGDFNVLEQNSEVEAYLMTMAKILNKFNMTVDYIDVGTEGHTHQAENLLNRITEETGGSYTYWDMRGISAEQRGAAVSQKFAEYDRAKRYEQIDRPGTMSDPKVVELRAGDVIKVLSLEE